MLTKAEVDEAGARLYVAVLNLLLNNEMDVARAMPSLVAKLHSDDNKLMAALLLGASNDPLYGPYHEELLTANLLHSYATQVAAIYNRKAVGNV